MLFTVALLASVVCAKAGLVDDVKREHEQQPSARQMADLIASADTVQIRGEMEQESASVVVRDPGWIQGVSRAMQAVALGKSVSCLCAGWRTAYFFREDRLLVSLAAIHGHHLRIAWTDGGGDFPIDEASWTSLQAALEYHPKPDPAPEMAIVKERDAVLAKIVAEIEGRHALGTVDAEAVWAAKLSLLSFRRDTAATTEEKLKQQALIVELQAKRLSTVEVRAKAGLADSLEVLRATDAWLAAKQRQAELQPKGKKG